MPALTIQPTVYFDNLLQPWATEAVSQGGVLPYPMPEAAPVSWISHRSLADFVFAAATRPGLEGQVFDVGGPEAVTGLEVAALLGRRLGRPVTYVYMRPDEFAVALNAVFGPPVGDDIADLYRRMAETPDVMKRDPAGWADLGVTPESAEAWIARQAWPVGG